jgi:mycothione reductase
MIILGGGYVSAEFAHIFSAFGTHVTVVNRSGALLRHEDGAISKRFTELMGKRVKVLLNRRVDRLEARADGRVGVHVVDTQRAATDSAQAAPQAGGETLEADVFLVATGRRPNGDTLNLSATGVEMDDEGYIIVDRHQCTTTKGIFALGDVSSHDQLKHVANYEMRLVRHNLLHPDDMRSSDDRAVPHAVFSEPQVASVGLTEEQAREQGIPYGVAVQDYGSVAYGWAMEDTDHFAKLLAEPKTGRILGAHIIGPQASSLIQPLIQAMSWDLGAKDMATGQYWIHPAMVELIENALIALPLEQ